MKRPITLWGASLACILALACAAGAVADERTTYEWSEDLDCSLCHVVQYESLYGTPGVDDKTVQNAAAEASADSKGEDAASADEPKENQSTGEADKPGETVEQEQEQGVSPEEAERIAKIDGYASSHVETFSFDCFVCHDDEEGMTKAHAKINSGKVSKILKKSVVADDVCLTCHNAQALEEATADVEVLVDEDGTLVNPHAVPVVDAHAAVMCVTCHVAHDTQATVQETALATCTSCHHANVYECGTCH